jgi:arabinan endo-1,5-alpha-L-arabinosidase
VRTDNIGISLRLGLVLPSVLTAALLAACTQSQPVASEASVDAASASATPGGYPDPLPLNGDIDLVHDPSMVRTSDGTYLLYSTGHNLQIRTSPDRTTFTAEGSVWPDGAPWTEPFTSPNDPSILWAPDISFHDGTFYLYYSASSFGSRNSAIFLATSSTGLSGTWKNRGKVWQTREDDEYNSIDPNLVVDDTGWWLSFGSFWSGLKMIRLDPETGKQHSKDQTLYSLATRPASVDGAVEAPYIVRHGGYYYLFASFDACCQGTSSTYRTMVGRSTSVTGPYVDKDGQKMSDGGGTEVLASHGSILGPGHPAVLQDGSAWLLIYHYYFDEFNPGAARLAMNTIDWVEGWPVVR